MALKLMGKKRGMIQLFDEKGNVIVGTVIEAEPNVVTQLKTKDTDGYNAIQLGFEKYKVKTSHTLDKRSKKPQRGHYQKSNIEPRKHLIESRIENVNDYSLGQEIDVGCFEEVIYLDATAMSKGKGYQGVMKLHNFAGGPAAHGSSFHRHAGSTGHRSSPGRSFPNSPRASHMGHEKITVQNLEIVQINKDENIIVVKGQVPGPNNGLVYLSPAVKKIGRNKKST
jgi:large subunit ribosomal protein L3